MCSDPCAQKALECDAFLSCTCNKSAFICMIWTHLCVQESSNIWCISDVHTDRADNMQLISSFEKRKGELQEFFCFGAEQVHRNCVARECAQGELKERTCEVEKILENFDVHTDCFDEMKLVRERTLMFVT